MEWLALLGLVVVVLFLAFSRKGQSLVDSPYEPQPAVFSPAERSFFGVISQAVGENAVVLGKMRIADVLRPKKGLSRSDWQKAFNRISAKHFDFVVCTPDTLSVIAVVELDDRSHSKKKREERDEFVERACASAGITLHRVKAEAAYNIGALREMIFPPEPVPEMAAVDSESVARESESTQVEQVEQSSVCPKCSSDLVRRVAKKGKHKGAEFLACSAYPKCRYVETPKA